jgi:hypothetical protein
MSAPRRWARRAVLSMLAGGGLSAAGFGGPWAGGALAAEAPVGTTTTEDQAPAVTETTPQAPASTQEASGAGGSTSTTSTTATEGSAGSSTTSTTPAQSGTATTPAAQSGTATTPAAPVSGGETAAPTVVAQRSQPTTPGRRHGASVTGSGKPGAGGEGSNAAGEGAGPGTAPAGATNGVAPAPQTAGEEAGVLATLLTGSTVSAQALDFYRIPLFLLPVYQAAAFQYGVPWQILAAINEIETDYGTDLSLSTAGAEGWMQFMPGTWLQYGVDATDAGYADPYNPVDAIFAAARYLRAAGASRHLRAAIFSYNHSQEYVESVLLRARLIASYPSAAIATLTGLVDGRPPTSGAHLAPGAVAAAEAMSMGAGASGAGPSAATPSGAAAAGPSNATAGAVATPLAPTPAAAAAAAQADASTRPGAAAGASASSAAHAAAIPGSTPAPSPQVAAKRAEAAANAPAKPSQLTDLLGKPNAPVVAVEDGRIEHMGRSRSLGRYVVLRDIYGDVFTYAGLGSIAPRYRPFVPREQTPAAGASANAAPGAEASTAASASQPDAAAGTGTGEPAHDPAPTVPASAGRQSPLTLKVRGHAQAPVPAGAPAEPEGENVPAGMGRVRLFAHPNNPIARTAAHAANGSDPRNGWAALRTGSIVSKGTVLGRLDTPAGASAGQLRFAVRPAGDGTTIDPQPLLANWRQLGAALHPKGSTNNGALVGATAGDALLMSKAELERAVLADPGIQLDTCGRRDVAAGTVDRRVLAALVFLSRSDLQPTVAALRCPRGGDSPSGLSVVAGPGAGAAAALRSAAGQAAAHNSGIAVDITAINGIPIAGHQGPGTVTDAAIRALLTLHGRFAPHRIVSLMRYPGVPATQALTAAWNHIHIEFLPAPPSATAHAAAAGPTAAAPLAATGELNGAEWSQLIERIATLPKPTVSVTPSSAAIRDPQAAPTNRGLGARGLAGN